MKHLFFITALFAVQAASAQALQPGQDTSVCPGQTVNFSGGFPDSSTTYFFQSPTTVTLQDDQFSPVINIGFGFTFYDSTYTQLVIGTNGILTFHTANAGGYCGWTANGMPFPNSTFFKNAIFPTFTDMGPATRIRYEVLGTVPNRKFVLQFQPVVSSCGPVCWTTAVVLHETTNFIDIHIKDKPACANGIEGIQNRQATVANVVPQSGNFTTTNSSKRWTRINATTYTISTIPFQFILDNSYVLSWVTPGGVFPYTDTFTVAAASTPMDVYPGLSSPDFCNGTPIPVSYDAISTITPYAPVHLAGVQLHNETCFGSEDGSFAFNVSGSNPAPYTIYWNNALTSDQSFDSLAPGNYPLSVTDGHACVLTDTITISGSAALLGQTLVATDVVTANDGSVVITASGGTPPYSYSIGGPFQSSDTFTLLSDGTYLSTVTDHNNCSDTLSFVILPPGAMRAAPSAIEFMNTSLSVEENTAKGIAFYPNPADEVLYVKLPVSGCTIALLDMAGKRCLSVIAGETASIDLSGLKAGMYIIRIEKDRTLLLSEKLTKR